MRFAKVPSRSFHISTVSNGRLKPTLKLRPPIEPTVKNIQVKDDHPLWQFFQNKKVVRSISDRQTDGFRSWNIAELRRKDFNDLHSLWYNCVKQRNLIAREARYFESLALSDVSTNSDALNDESEKIRTTMWRIRYVLGERQNAFERFQTKFPEYKTEFLQTFRESYLQSKEDEFEDIEEQLYRLNVALFGSDVSLIESGEDVNIDQNFVDGIIYTANLKIAKYATDDFKQEFGELTNGFLAFPLFTTLGKKSIEKELETVQKMKNDKDVYVKTLNMVPAKQVEEAIIYLAQ